MIPLPPGTPTHVLFLADGRIVGTMDDPTPQRVLDRLKALAA